MGNICGWESPLTDTQPEAITGLTRREKKLIKDLWYNVNTKKTFRDNGSRFFIMLFIKYPYIKEYFREFAPLSNEELHLSLSLRAHGIAVFTAIANYVDCLDDPSILIEMIYKRTLKHYYRNVTNNDMEIFKEVLLEFFLNTTNLSRNKKDAVAAWDKFLTFHNEIFRAKFDHIKMSDHHFRNSDTFITSLQSTSTTSGAAFLPKKNKSWTHLKLMSSVVQ